MNDKSSQPLLPETDTAEPQQILPEDAVVDSGNTPDAKETLSALNQVMRECNAKLGEVQESTRGRAQATLTAIEASDLSEAESQLLLLQEALTHWKDKWTDWERAAQQAAGRIGAESEIRPDLNLETLLGGVPPVGENPESTIEWLSAALEHVLDYDRQRHEGVQQLIRNRATIVQLQSEVAEWTYDEPAEAKVSTYFEALDAELTLAEVKEMVEQIGAERRGLEERCAQLRELGLNRIAALAAWLQEHDVSGETALTPDLNLGDVEPTAIANLPPRHLTLIEQALNEVVSEKMMKSKSAALATRVAELQSDWSDGKLVDVLQHLSDERWDVEALLLLLSASSAHPWAQEIALPPIVVSSLLRGVEHLAKTHPFGLLNSLAPDFLNSWEAADRNSQAELCLVMMAAQYGGGTRLPNGFLWQFPAEWPVAEMQNWNRVWQAALQDEPLPIITPTLDRDWTGDLEKARSHSEQVFAREHGFFVRLNSLRSRRHQAMVGSEIMPALLSQLEALQNIENDLRSAHQEESRQALAALLTRLERSLSEELPAALDEDTLTESYEDGVLRHGIDDTDPFHRRTALRMMQDCAESILEFGRALLEFWRMQLLSEANVTHDALQAELKALCNLTQLGQTALEEIVRSQDRKLNSWNGSGARDSVSRQLTHELLSQPSHALRLPRVVGHLAGTGLNWAELLSPLLDDLVEPVGATGAANLLLEQDASNQALLLTQYLPLDIQKQAQALKREREREVEALETEVLKAGGSTEDLIDERNLGRWRLVRRELAERLAEHQSVRMAAERRIRERARRLRSAINDLDEAVFASMGTMPTEAYRLVEQGLNLARQATATDALFDAVETYLQEIRYRIEHKSWPLAELNNANAQIETAMAGEAAATATSLRAQDVLEVLEQGEIRSLGLSPNEVAASEIGTRSDLLRNWLAVHSLPAFLSKDLKAIDRATIQALYRYFARMVAMKRVKEVSGKPMAYEDPVVYAWWELQYPKTAVLQNQCIFVTLPGEPPSAKDLAELDHILEDKGWLEYFFVFLFVPGSTPSIRRRLQSTYQNRGLVIIDEAALLDMMLAEAKYNNPLGRLRPLVLNALGAENVDVFKINQLVDSRTSIFVGRDALVERVASSGDNYALYGGRRIGKSSILMALEDRLQRRGVSVISHSFEGYDDCSDDSSARYLGRLLKLENGVRDVGDFKLAIQDYMDKNASLQVVFLLDEVDRYILENPSRHVLIEALRALSDRYGSRFRIVIAGFMSLHDCLRGRGPYTPSSDPWVRMLNDIGPVENLRPASAEQIVREGFVGILGWEFENRAIPQRIVERTGGHPAFVQYFCLKLQQQAGRRGDRLIRLEDVADTFDDRDPEQSFIAYVRKTLEMNLDPIARYLILWLAAESSEAQSFTLEQMRELAALSESTIPEERLSRSLERLAVTGVVKERAPEVYDFSVPDYPLILSQLGETAHLEELEDELEEYLRRELDDDDF